MSQPNFALKCSAEVKSYILLSQFSVYNFKTY